MTILCPVIKLACCGCVCGWGISENSTFFQWEWCCWTDIYAVLGVCFGNSLIISSSAAFPQEFTKGLSQRILLWGPGFPILVQFACCCGAFVEEEKSYGHGGWPTPPLRWDKSLCPAYLTGCWGAHGGSGAVSWTPSTSHLAQSEQSLFGAPAQREQTGRHQVGWLTLLHPLPGFALLGTADHSGALWGSFCCMDRNGSSEAFVRVMCEFMSPKGQRSALTSALLHWL